MWCPKCKTEYRDGITVCADCGSPLVLSEQKSRVNICEINDEKAAEEIVEYLSYSGVPDAAKEACEDGSFRITVAKEDEKSAEKLFRGYTLAKEEAKEAKRKQSLENGAAKESLMPEGAVSDEDATVPEEEIDEDTADLLYTSDKKEFVKCADRYRDLKFSGITFLIFGIAGVIYLVLSKTKVIPIEYNIVVFCIISVLFAAFIISGIVSIVKAQKIRHMIPQEEEKTAQLKEWLEQNVTAEKIQAWSDNQVTDVENDLLITAHIRSMLLKEYPDEKKEYLEMIADEYYEEQFISQE